MAKPILLVKEKEPLRERTIFDLCDNLFFSGFCLTDNVNFSEFYLIEIPKECKKEFKEFIFDEESLIFQIGDQPRIIFDEDEKNVKFDNLFIDKEFFLYFTNKYPSANFFWLKSFLKEPICGLVGVLIGTKMVGLLKLKQN
jgi:hypothetical protein